MMELLIGITKNYKIFNPITPAFKMGLDLSGCLLILGLLFALAHWIIYREAEQTFIDIQSLILLVGVMVSGLLSVACRNLLSLDDSSFLAPLEYAMGKLSILLACPLGEIHHWLFYFHITMAAAVIAYIPFSKLLHIFATPIGRIATMGEGYVEKKRIKVSEGLL
jgi:nitrate reductase gamma subunit